MVDGDSVRQKGQFGDRASDALAGLDGSTHVLPGDVQIAKYGDAVHRIRLRM